MASVLSQRAASRSAPQPVHHSSEEVRQRLLALDARASSGGLVGSVPRPALALTPEDDGDSSPFECNICLEMARDPVVTLCGHLYCWPCLYKWLHTAGKSRTCPVCKSAVDKKKVVPIYGRGGAADVSEGEDQIPSRPGGMAVQQNFMSKLFGSSSAQPSLMNSIFILEEEINSPEHQHQAILARLLLMLGSFVIMFLLLI